MRGLSPLTPIIGQRFTYCRGAAAACISGTPETDGVVFEWKVGVGTALGCCCWLLLVCPHVEASLPNNGSRLGRQECGVVGCGNRREGDEYLVWSLEWL